MGGSGAASQLSGNGGPYSGCAIGARRVVEFATSYGVSTIYLAAAVRDNVATIGGRGLVIGTEHEPTKAAAARDNLAEAGLERFVEVVGPRLRRGAIVLCDNAAAYEREYRDHLAYVRDPARFRSLLWPHKGGVELSVRLAPVRTPSTRRTAPGDARRRRRAGRSS